MCEAAPGRSESICLESFAGVEQVERPNALPVCVRGRGRVRSHTLLADLLIKRGKADQQKEKHEEAGDLLYAASFQDGSGPSRRNGRRRCRGWIGHQRSNALERLLNRSIVLLSGLGS